MLVQFAMFSSAIAQTSSGQTGVLVVAYPNETIVRLKGDYDFSGKAPFSIPQNLSGPYSLSASKRGYESKSLKIYFDEKPFHELNLTLQPISRFKAGFRSLILPGSGQRYKGAKGRGLFFTGLALGAGVGTLVTALNYQSDLDAANDARANYMRVSNSFDDAQAAYENWQSAYRDAQDSYDRRQRSLMITAIVWGINFLDALLMPPGPGADTSWQAPLKGRLGYNQSQLELNFSF